MYGTPVTSEEDPIARVHTTERLKVLQDNWTYSVMFVKLSTADVGGSEMT